MNPSRAMWALAAVAFVGAGVLDSAAALLHWDPCIGVDFDTAACIEAQRDYQYYLPYAADGSDWQPLSRAPLLAALAFALTAAGWIAVVVGLRPAARGRWLLMFPAILPALSGVEVLVGLAGGVLLGLLLTALSLGVLAASLAVGAIVIREQALVPALITVLGLLAVNASGFPALLVGYLGWSSFYGSFDNPPFLGLERGLLGVGAGLVIGLVAALARPAGSPAHRAGAALEGAAHR